MKKIFLILAMNLAFLNAAEMGLNGGSCTLAQEGKMQLQVKETLVSDATYVPNAKSGKNFREIFVGSVISNKDLSLKIVDYRPNKREKGKPKTGLFMVDIITPTLTKSIRMTYIFDKGMISATGIFNKASISFSSKVSYSLCNVSIKK